MKNLLMLLVGALPALTMRADGLVGWERLYYPGLEASGEVRMNPTGFRGKEPAIELEYLSGMPNFGVKKSVKSELKGCVEWTVSARLRCATGGLGRVSMEFFDAAGKTLGRQDGARRIYTDWTRTDWKFVSPRSAVRAEVHLVSCERVPVAFAGVRITSAPGIDKGELPFRMALLPVDWNKDWNGGRLRMTSFAEAPIPLSVLFAGDRRELKAPWFELELPQGLELRSAYCPYILDSGIETPTETEELPRGVRRLRFSKLAYFKHMDRVNFEADRGGSVALLLAPMKGVDTRSFTVVCRIGDGKQNAEERRFELKFDELPGNGGAPAKFPVFSWNNVDRNFQEDSVVDASLRAFERAGVCSFRKQLGNYRCDLTRNLALAEKLEAREANYIFSGRFGDLTRPGVCGLTRPRMAEFGLHRSTTLIGDKLKPEGNAHICPQQIIDNPHYRRHLRDAVIRPSLEESKVVDGDWVTIDIEPWQPTEYCYCGECLEAFAKHAGLKEAPDAVRARSLRDEWARFRVWQNSRQIEAIAGFIHEYNPRLRVMDYDYILMYGDEEKRMRFLRGCAKDPLANERWLDGHVCSYYHTVGKAAFEAMRNNRRNLKKLYFPMAGMCGYGSYLRPGEVLNPAQFRQFVLAAFVNGCDGCAVYSGNYFDGEILAAMIRAQGELGRYAGLPWGRADGRTSASSDSEQFAFASVTAPGGREVLALFNYDTDERIEVRVGDRKFDLAPNEVRFVELAGGIDSTAGDVVNYAQ